MRFSPSRSGGTNRSSRRDTRPPKRLLPRLEALEARDLLAGSIAGTVFSDVDRNLVQTTGEPGLANVPVYLDLNGDGIRDQLATTVSSTAAQEVTASTPLQSTLNVSLPKGALVTNVAVSVKVTITDQSRQGEFWYDWVDLAHVSDGYNNVYTMAQYMSGNLDLTFDDSSANNRKDLQPANQATHQLPPGGSNTWTGTYNTRYQQDGPGLKGYVGSEAAGEWSLSVNLGADATLDSWSLTVTYQEPLTKSDANGVYTFENVPAGSYPLVADFAPPAGQPSWSQLNPQDTGSVVVTDGESTTANFAIRVPALGGQVTVQGQPAKADIPIFLDLNGNGTFDAAEPQTVTDGNGKYAFQNFTTAALNTPYTVRLDAEAVWGKVATPTFPTVNLSEDNPAADISVVLPTVSGILYQSSDPALAGFPIYIDNDGNGAYDPGEPLTTTGIDGTFSFTPEQLKTARPGTYSVRTESGWLWAPIGAIPQVSLPAGATDLGLAIRNNAPPVQGDDYTSTTFDITPAQQYMMERSNVVRANPRGALLGPDYLDSQLFKWRIEAFGPTTLADWTAAVNGYPDALQPLAWDPNLIRAASQQGEQTRDLAVRRHTLMPQYIPTADFAGNPVTRDDFVTELRGQSDATFPAFFSRYFGGQPTTAASSGEDGEVGAYNYIATFSVPGLPGFDAFRGYGTTEERAVLDYYNRYRAYVNALQDPGGISHWVPQSRYGDSFAYRSNANGGRGRAENGGYGRLVDYDRAFIIDIGSQLFSLDRPPYENLIGTSHGLPFIDPTTRTMGMGSEASPWQYLNPQNGVMPKGGFYDPHEGSLYQWGVYGGGKDNVAYVVGVAYNQDFKGGEPLVGYSYLSPRSKPLAQVPVHLTASYTNTSGQLVAFSHQDTTTWTGGGYQFQVVRPTAADYDPAQPLTLEVHFNNDLSTLQTVTMGTDRNTANEQNGNLGTLLNAKVDHYTTTITDPPPPPDGQEGSPQFIEFPAVGDRTYGDAPVVLQATTTSGLPVLYEVLAGPAFLTGDVLTITGAGTITVQANQPGDLFYASATPVVQTFTANKATLKLTVDNKSKAYGEALPILTGTMTGVVNGDDITTTYGTTATSGSDVIPGGYPITARFNDPGDRLSNYSIINTPGKLTVTKADQTIVWANPADIVYGTPLGAAQLNARVVVIGPSAGGELTYSPPFDTVLGVGKGQTLWVTAADTQNYNAATASVVINVLPSLAITGPTTGVRGQPRQFTFTAGGTPGDNAYTIDWGDGSKQVLGAGASLTVDHVYASAGNYVIQATVHTGDGDTSPLASHAIGIEAMALQPDPVQPASTALVVGGTGEQDVVLVMSIGTNTTLLQFNGATTVVPGVSRVIVYGQGGNDVLMASTSSAPVWLFGDAGDDVIFGSNRNDLLVGGAGNDALYGLSGDDILIGGAGADALFGGNGDDILIGGTTAFDQNAVALAFLQREWNSGRSYDQRVANLRGDATSPGSDQRLNGEVFLRAAGDGATVFDDEAVDSLFGQSGRDWFFAGLDGPLADRLLDRELVEALDRLRNEL